MTVRQIPHGATEKRGPPIHMPQAVPDPHRFVECPHRHGVAESPTPLLGVLDLQLENGGQILLLLQLEFPTQPVLLAQGGSGATPVPLSIEPGACYLAIVSVVQGATRSVGLRVHVGVRDAFDDRGVDENGAVVAFCAGDRSDALALVEARGTPLLGWGMALYRVGAWEVPP